MAEKFLTQEQLSVFCSSLAMLLRSGASLSEVSSLFEEDGMDTALRQASTEISLSVAAGEPFSAAAEKTGVFPEYALSVFSTAELSGRLDEALDRLADHYDRQSALYDRLRSTLTYPAVLMLMMCGVLAAVNRLPARYRTVLYLYYYEGYQAAEIGRILGIPTATVNTRLARGRGKLKLELGGTEYEQQTV